MVVSYLKKLVPRQFHPHMWVKNNIDDLPAVAAGPFKGMLYPDNESKTVFSARLLGTYEKELYPIIEECCARNFENIVDIGAAEGYYAVGLCKRCPGAKMTAYETVKFKRGLLEQMAALNGVADRITLGGLCSSEDLRQEFDGKSEVFLIMDIEGGERALLDPEEVPGLRTATILVELHDVFAEFSDVAEVIRQRFEGTHEIREIIGEDRDLSDLPFVVPFLYRKYCGGRIMSKMDEKRPNNMHWYFMTPRTAASFVSEAGNNLV